MTLVRLRQIFAALLHIAGGSILIFALYGAYRAAMVDHAKLFAASAVLAAFGVLVIAAGLALYPKDYE